MTYSHCELHITKTEGLRDVYSKLGHNLVHPVAPTLFLFSEHVQRGRDRKLFDPADEMSSHAQSY